MELFEWIRRGYAAGEMIQGLAKKYGIAGAILHDLGKIETDELTGLRLDYAVRGQLVEHITLASRSWNATQGNKMGVSNRDQDRPGASDWEHPQRSGIKIGMICR